MVKNAIGIDVGGTKLLGVVIDEDGKVVKSSRIPTPDGLESILDAICELFGDLQKDLADEGREQSTSLGLGIPGPIDNTGLVTLAPNLIGVANVNFAAVLTARLPGVFVNAENDANVAGWGERTHGAGMGKANVIMITLGTGVGGGIVVDGQLLRGSFGLAAEVGHMVVDPNGPQCPCGKQGCWEQFASGSGLGRLARESANRNPNTKMLELADGDSGKINGEICMAAVRIGDEIATEVLNRYANWVALGLGNLANLFDPEMFVVGGGLAEQGELILKPIQIAYEQIAFHSPTSIQIATLGEFAGAIGAADLARTLASRG